MPNIPNIPIGKKMFGLASRTAARRLPNSSNRSVFGVFGFVWRSLKEGTMLKAAVIGNLGSDPEMKYSQDGRPFLRCNVASNYRARVDGEWQDRTEWVRVTVFGARAESLSQHLKKGMRVYCDGRLEARPWSDQQGNVRAGLELIASDVEFASSRQDDGQQSRPVARQEQSDDLDDIPF